MRVQYWLVVLAALAPAAGHAQALTADGVRALVRGDYAAAMRILEPLADDDRQPDPLAAFFLASLYETGRGVAPNPARACGLYLRAATSANPLQSQAEVLARTIHLDKPMMMQLCAEASLSGWRNPPAASFTLGADHWVRIGEAGIVVGYKGVEKPAAVGLGGPGFVFLPIRYTRIEVPGPVVAFRRHFVEFFTWVPHMGSNEAPWALWWSALEVIGTDTLSVPGQFILTAASPSTSADVTALARIQLNADGEAEWRVFGANPRTSVIPYRGSR